MLDCKLVSTPSQNNSNSSFEYRKPVGLLNYVATCTRPDLAYSTSSLSQFLDSPSDEHGAAFKRILRYLQGTTDYSLVLGGSNLFSTIIGYSDSGWCSNYDGKSFSGFGVILGGLISWKTKKQSTASLSTTEAELKGLVELTQDILWLKKLLVNLRIEPSVQL
ncbi:hypothetical protein O181_025473 [Austropuccinia psidii MF-1]|uniref:Reverse transcriptase Ty1/copia-type domain-containing protein n=1 Tax=Austropuccinia psidii MF-1 TaxID=1389203 RepID=A0A9Q3CMV6_9BASI|nr:hypothetical protein [Austropuccinia psidii MF-1]